MWQSVRALFLNPRFLLGVYIFAAIFISVQLVLLGTHLFSIPDLSKSPTDIMNKPEYVNLFLGKYHTQYNNYIIFKSSWFHLIHGTNLYTVYPDDHWDFYKYSPTFALFMGAIAYLPDMLGLSIWNILNGVTLYFAIRMLPFSNKAQCLLMWFIGNELLTCFSNTQSNGLMCALIVAAYGCMQREKIMWATLWLVVATFIKVYGAVGFCLFLFYPGKFRFILYAALWTVVLAALPLIVTPYNILVWQYHNWVDLMKADAAEATGLSIVGWLNSWFGIRNIGTYVTPAGMVLFVIPFARIRMYKDEVFKLLILAFTLIWVIIFNHKAESPTYIIATTGVAIWYFASPRATWRTALLMLVLVFTTLSTTDFFPQYVRVNFIYPYKIKAVPCILAWCVVFIELMLLKRSADNGKTTPVAASNTLPAN
jgi:Glycosyltransferase family 87